MFVWVSFMILLCFASFVILLCFAAHGAESDDADVSVCGANAYCTWGVRRSPTGGGITAGRGSVRRGGPTFQTTGNTLPCHHSNAKWRCRAADGKAAKTSQCTLNFLSQHRTNVCAWFGFILALYLRSVTLGIISWQSYWNTDSSWFHPWSYSKGPGILMWKAIAFFLHIQCLFFVHGMLDLKN